MRDSSASLPPARPIVVMSPLFRRWIEAPGSAVAFYDYRITLRRVLGDGLVCVDTPKNVVQCI